MGRKKPANLLYYIINIKNFNYFCIYFSGIILKLEEFYRYSSSKFIHRHWLALPTDHYSGSYGDRGWGCGYRNFQMLLSCLAKIPEYQQVLFNGM